MITRYAPEGLRSFDRFERMMRDFFGNDDINASTWMPSVDIKDADGTIILRAELPGLKEEDVEVELEGDRLTLRGMRRFEDEDRRKDYVRIERSYGQFQRTFTLGVPVKADEIKADFKDGLLTVTVPKAEGRKPQKIAVNA